MEKYFITYSSVSKKQWYIKDEFFKNTKKTIIVELNYDSINEKELIKYICLNGDVLIGTENRVKLISINTLTQINSFNNEFKIAVEPAIRYLLKNHNPHTSIFIHYDNAELLIGEECHNLSSEVPD